MAAAVIAIGAQVKAASARKSTLATLKVCEGLMIEYLAMGNPEPGITATTTWLFGSPSGASVYSTMWSNPWNAPPENPYLPDGLGDPVTWTQALSTVPEFDKKLTALPHATMSKEIVLGSSLPNPAGAGLRRFDPSRTGDAAYVAFYTAAWNYDPMPLFGQGRMSDWPMDNRRASRFLETIDKNGNTLATPIMHFSMPNFPLILDAWGNPVRYVPSANGRKGYFESAGPDGLFFGSIFPVNRSGRKNDDVLSTDPQ